jgi:hypothetical protein
LHDLSHDLRNAEFFLEDVVGKLLSRKVFKVLPGGWILDIEIEIIGEGLFDGDFPRLRILLPLIPPFQVRLELGEQQGLPPTDCRRAA